ncbi:hypothetical protein EDB81DRAFT_764436 [Dactylonectria macrodidyma]|uniref:Apple domain-containing protein n=1 Tax=Dactylonectria macrodidyma TaxID=307937 RepID=A0A9P9ISB9_9HYPO|nr:hypothetical protein EDB81DRAFT_764436 [Dactylonectria macrodidyma]
MVSFKGLTIFSILALGRVNASIDPDDDCDDETALSTTGHHPTSSVSTYSSSTSTIIIPSSAASHVLNDVEDADEVLLSGTAHQPTGSATTFSSSTTTLIIPNSDASHVLNDVEDVDEVRLYSTTFVTSIVSVSSSAASVATPGSQGGHAPKSCKAVAPPPAGRTCGVEGYINQADQSGRWPPQKKDSLKECATLCFSGPDCTAFRYRQDGNCQIFTQEFSSYGFTAGTSGSYWYQKECFECSDDGTVLGIDFHDNDVSNWCFTGDVDDSFELDIQTSDGLSSLRVRELATQGVAQVEYLTEFQVESETTYEMVFNVRSNLPVGRQTGLPDTDFKLLTFYVSTNDKVIYETIPVDGVWNGGEGWFKFSSKFVVQSGEKGAATLSFAVHASGSQLDWYLGYLYINSV